ncbi:Uncharacterized protein TCM_000143 [Theobroma cacao]|uniref:Uncharacterized protein n=1 Tax=Theobroma cacao TaxID=3641 RepID=A0A061DF92_THECC|nr:Uncharacterized protein TCM_000143 [Theobroma cacao]
MLRSDNRPACCEDADTVAATRLRVFHVFKDRGDVVVSTKGKREICVRPLIFQFHQSQNEFPLIDDDDALLVIIGLSAPLNQCFINSKGTLQH